MDDCIFCKLANHQIPTSIVYEDDDFCAFKDANPQAPVHVLVVPKRHFANVADDVPTEVLGGLLKTAVKVAEICGIRDKGFRLIMNTGADAGQTVMHLHCHVLGGVDMGEGMLPR
ncbi:MAG: histidine triad nucleotide-binding protein [Coriobacteriales bacterium]|jgi:histidine triad (HIT) family protein